MKNSPPSLSSFSFVINDYIEYIRLFQSGVIGPRSTVNIEAVFCPKEAEMYQTIAYLDVTGRETRQPLKMVGTGLGPEVTLNFKVLDVENLYLCAKHQYEIVAKNEGELNKEKFG